MTDFTHPAYDDVDYLDRYVGDAEITSFNPFEYRNWVESLAYEDRLQADPACR